MGDGCVLDDNVASPAGKRALRYVVTAIANFGSFRIGLKDVMCW